MDRQALKEMAGLGTTLGLAAGGEGYKGRSRVVGFRGMAVGSVDRAVGGE